MLRHVVRQVDVQVVYYPASLTEEMLLDRRVISLPKTKLSLRNTLEILSRQLPIGYYAEGGQLVINSSNEAGSVLTTGFTLFRTQPVRNGRLLQTWIRGSRWSPERLIPTPGKM